ncbi:NAD(P)H-dependent oxidoreductase [Chelatococcus asaccharovorans]|uniref:Putative NADPH-quinone reductase n=1 Tax=Chelatococcus asaccharovorans TaxID=28210 RepID=A0A2V3TRM6_9HYPH|nr:NAD(P)H-dependent oxidoreductase [Chelatococcus asaccharovorans]MBS7704867.1 NAD(P)H-dependent oxidoreductase [Chelatococcus asaccharovorans]PXW51330.1 putative NADPH-quinone reductase [Chelatococcus asaccharovorans]CAH1650753.1 putative NADPH-quinone reductase [Chelatococcus asaccharovorans]CAH1686719.1 putative NADPH-quinone reductase [Chelatococcus asaccharovorans]
MPRRIVIIQGHPDPDEQRLCRGLANAYGEGAREAGHEVTFVDLASLDIPFLRSQSSFENDPVPPSLKPAQEAILAAEHIVIVFPLWLGTMPALVKAFLEQVMRPGFAFGYDKGVPKTNLSGRSARLVVTMSMPVMAYRWWYFGHGLKALQHNILRFVGIGPVRESLFGMVTGVSDATRRGWLDTMRALGRQGA